MIRDRRFSERVRELAVGDPKYSLFGSELHKYAFGSCLTDPGLRKLEAAYRVDLPDDYRSFLSSVGNGGAGPGYGLLPLAPPVGEQHASTKQMGVTIKDAKGRVVHRASYEDPTNLAAAANSRAAAHVFPLTTAFRSISDEMWAIGIPNWNDVLCAQNQLNRTSFAAIPFGDGVLKVASYGSGIFGVLVLEGRFRGQVWIVDPNMGDYVPASMRTDLHDRTIKVECAYAQHKAAFTFIDWYDHWLCTAESPRAIRS